MVFNANYNKTSRRNPTKKLNDVKDAVFGIYLAEIVSTKDVSRTGRVRVFIPAISKDKNSTAGYFDAIWTTPFGGTTDPRTVGKDINAPEESMSSYGFWATVPDNGNLVLVAFGDGNTKYPLVMSCLLGDKFNYMLPGNAGGKTYQAPNLELPTVEKNKRTADINHNDTFRPIQHTLAENIVKQGLAYDPIRGAGSSTARRESPSEVFGMLTPGPRDPDNFNYRLGGHQLVMDDNLGSRQIRIRTAQGSQLLLDDTSGMIYMINRDGTVWWEMSQTGDFFVYAEGDINMRAKKDFNLRADGDVNIEAGLNLNIKAAGDMEAGEYQGEGQNKGAGTIKIDAKGEMHQIAQLNTFQTTIEGEHHINSAGSFNNTTQGDMNLKVGGAIVQSAGSGFSTKAGSDIILQTGAQIVEKGSQVLMNSGGGSAQEAPESKPATPKTTIDHDDNPSEPPEYDRTAESPVTTSGLRTGDGATIASIATVLVTSEPFEGHGIPDPAKDDQGNMVPDENLAGGFGPNGGNGVSTVADNNSPSGFQAGTVNSDGKAVYTNPSQLTNNFTLAKNKKVEGQMIQDATRSMANSIPPVRQPTMTPNGAIALGMNGKITQLQHNAKTLAFDVKGVPQDLRRADIKKTQNIIGAAMTQYGINKALGNNVPDRPGFLQALAAQNITEFNQGNDLIYVDGGGNKLVYFKKGLGNIGASMLTGSNLLNTSRIVRNFVDVPISDNQMIALLSFADHIGHENFAKSKVLQAVNQGNYKAVPQLMTAHSVMKQGGKNRVQSDHLQRRQFEGELWMTPDAVSVPSYDKRVSYGKQAKDLKKARAALL